MTFFSKTPAARGARILSMVSPRALLLLAFLAVSASPQTVTDVSGLAWLAGHWAGPVGRAAAEEHWIAPAGGAMLGVSRTIVKERMVAFEFLRIEKRGNDIFYVAQPGGRPPTSFKLTQYTATTAVFENPQHDFPQLISYRLEGPDTLVAKIEGGDGAQRKTQEFRFTRVARAQLVAQ